MKPRRQPSKPRRREPEVHYIRRLILKATERTPVVGSNLPIAQTVVDGAGQHGRDGQRRRVNLEGLACRAGAIQFPEPHAIERLFAEAQRVPR